MISIDSPHHPSADGITIDSCLPTPDDDGSLDCCHYPSDDDISFDSLEYLFGTAGADCQEKIPWVEIETISTLSRKYTEEYERKLAFLEKQLQASVRQTQRLCMLVGYLQGQMLEKDEQLKNLSDWRFKAAMAVAEKVELERCRERILELESVIEQLNKQNFVAKLEEVLRRLVSSYSSDEAAISILMWLGFINLSGILFTILYGF